MKKLLVGILVFSILFGGATVAKKVSETVAWSPGGGGGGGNATG